MADNLPDSSNTFDIVTVFENVYGFITLRTARIGSLREIKRVLKQGGIAMLAVNTIYNRLR
jgi:SAM-dependent methyltransferase